MLVLALEKPSLEKNSILRKSFANGAGGGAPHNVQTNEGREGVKVFLNNVKKLHFSYRGASLRDAIP